MKKYILPSIKLTLVMVVLSAAFYPLVVAGIARMAAGQGRGETLSVKGRVVGYANVGQKFTRVNYFWGRPSAVDYNAAGSGGSNKGPSNPEYLQAIQSRIDSFLKYNPDVKKEEIPAEMVTASGSGLDPHISPVSAKIQVRRIAAARKMDEITLIKLVDTYTEGPLLGILGPSKVNVLKLNIALDELKNN